MNDYKGLFSEALKECVTYWDGYFGEANDIEQLMETAKVMVERQQVYPETVAVYRKCWDHLIAKQLELDPLKGITTEATT